jgi:non-specific serine/threonine protein kinase/serine/threonine-protein kinase
MPEALPPLRDLFDFALALPDAERPRYVARISESDPAIGRELQALLDADAAAGTFLSTPAPERVALFSSDLAGLVIGPYRVLERVGSGGMGTVFAAERIDRSFQWRVAIKVVRLGFGMDERIARFQRERQILAQLDHPNIARLIDGGTLGESVPYLVMEYVEGKPIDAYCEDGALSLADRLRLMMRVCAAVHFAHQRLVIHRDIKPTNILVDAGGQPKLLDFGIATILEPAGAAQDQLTHTGCFVVTPDYASPEQVRGELVTTASDVYALGVVLYRLLSGKAPYHVGSRSPQEIVRAVCETNPVPPSEAVLADITAEAPDRQAALRRARALRGDLDTIVSMAMHKDPARRYASPARLADDLRRHLEGRPVHARPDTPSYRMAKFVRRNRAGVALAAALVLATIAGTISTVWQAREATRQRAIAEKRLGDIRRLATSFIFEVHDSITALPGATPARRLVSQLGGEYLDRLADESGGDPVLLLELADAYDRLGDVQGNPAVANLGNDVAALESYRKALGIRVGLVRRGQASDAEAGLDVSGVGGGDALVEAGRPGDASHEYARALEIRERLLAAAPDNTTLQRRVLEVVQRLCRIEVLPDVAARVTHCARARDLCNDLVRDDPSDEGLLLQRATALLNLGEAEVAAGGAADAVQSLRAAADGFTVVLARDGDNLRALRGQGLALRGLAGALVAQGRHGEGLQYLGRARATCERLVARDPGSARYRIDLAGVLELQAGTLDALGQRDEAVASTERAITLLTMDGPGPGGALRERLVRALDAYRAR